MQNWQIFQACFSCFAVVWQVEYYTQHFPIPSVELQWKKTITEKEIVKVTQVRMSVACLYLWLRFWKAVSQISIWLVKKAVFTIHYSIDMFGKAEMRWKGTCFDRRVKTLKCEWVGIIAHINRPISVKARNNFRSFYNGSVMKLKYLHLNKLFLSSPFIQARLY